MRTAQFKICVGFAVFAVLIIAAAVFLRNSRGLWEFFLSRHLPGFEVFISDNEEETPASVPEATPAPIDDDAIIAKKLEIDVEKV